ncbi:metallophosphoesterase [Flavobacterium caeni]|uniref:Serine/threonine protein phosphatase 1 n=1 Tax=Flavobacterium caeni TaxID=490189 RepID=A0A1G5GW08_9FLAO|nr:metallophosphoesterase [Flavobacterium caeni]SCY55674.1 serine/threonine protein phosphatase 1 [Flavobacterium caeni]
MNRTLVIGDIHGALIALKQVLERAQVNRSDQLIFLGDYADGWSQTPQLLDFLIEFRKTHDCIFMRGNHDELLWQWLGGAKDNLLWNKHGGSVTIAAYETIDSDIRKKHRDFLGSLQDYHLDEDNRLFVHAGFTSLHGVTLEHFPRMLYWDRTLWETALALDPTMKTDDLAYPRRLLLYKEIFLGHTPVTRIGQTVPVKRGNIWNVDTGAAFHGPLTIMDVDSKKFWQSDPLPQLYPEENGRNL